MSSPEGSSVIFRRVPQNFRRGAVLRFARTLESNVTAGRPFDCLITSGTELRRLNRTFRGKDETTDVLSFPSGHHRGRSAPLGDLAISLPRARSQARQFSHPVETEVCLLMLHGVLHLMGMDHEADAGKMARTERIWRGKLGLPAGLIERVRP